jgi:serine/threonine-protein kinase RsbW
VAADKRGGGVGSGGRATVARHPMAETAPVRLVVPSQTSFLGLVRDITQRVAELCGYDEGTAQKLALAVDEAATNAIKHAYGGAEDREVEIRYREVGEDFCIEIIDSGAMVDPRAIPRVDLSRYVSEGRTGGLGVHLMEKIMDSVSFGRTSGRNVCCLVKRRAGDREPER